MKIGIAVRQPASIPPDKNVVHQHKEDRKAAEQVHAVQAFPAAHGVYQTPSVLVFHFASCNLGNTFHVYFSIDPVFNRRTLVFSLAIASSALERRG